jgi:hypothetical protein
MEKGPVTAPPGKQAGAGPFLLSSTRRYPVHVQEPPAVMAAESVPLLRLAASCPQCGSRPAVRVTPAVVQAMARQPPEARMGTYQCHRRRCGAIFDLAARAFQRAS